MLLRRFEAHGFKSFADKIDIEFGTGVTAIVGPNGSGKSNISDAIRWVLGEQNIRNLRGTKHEDIIFSGSSARRSLNVAEVSLTFDNSDGQIPIDYNEVIITRRLYRSGDSDYLINKSACRLKDIHELLSEAGLGRGSMTIISQSKADEILNSRPEERRLLFEDAAGITKYKQRKREALRKLDDTEVNIIRVADIMAEIESRLEPLAISADKTKQYNVYQAELIAAQVSLLLHKYERAQAMLSDISHEQTSTKEKHLNEASRLATGEAAAEVLIHEVAGLTEKLQIKERELSSVVTELEKNDSQLAVLSERTVQKSLALKRVEQDLSQLQTKLQFMTDTELELNEAVMIKQTEIVAAQCELAAVEKQLAATSTTIAAIETEVVAANETMFISLQATSSQRNYKLNYERDLLRVRAQYSRLEREQADYNDKLRTIREQQQANKYDYQQHVDNLANTIAEQEQLRINQATWGAKAADVELQINRLDLQLSQAQSRLTILSNLQRDFEGFNRGSKAVLNGRATWSSGICGAVAQLITVPNQYVVAIEIALGGALQDIVTIDEATAKAAIASLKEQRAGRVTFLPLTTIRPRPARQNEINAASALGSLGFAANLIKYEERYQPIINYLLGRVIVAEDLERALQIARDAAFSVRLVTLEGEVINPGGAMAGGSTMRRESSFLGRTMEINDLKQKIEQWQTQRLGLEERLSTFKQELLNLDTTVQELAKQHQDYLLLKTQCCSVREQLEREFAQIQAALTTIGLEIEQSKAEEILLAQKLQAAEQAILQLEQQDSCQKELTATRQVELQKLRHDKERLAEQVTEHTIVVNRIEHDIKSTNQLVAAKRKDITELEIKQHELLLEVETINQEIMQSDIEQQRLEQERGELENKQQLLDKERVILMETKALQLIELQKTETINKELRRQLNILDSRLHELQLMLTRYEFELKTATDQIVEQHNLTLEAAQQLRRTGAPQSLLNNVKRLEQDIIALGPVNHGAIEEYNAVNDRYKFLTSQQQDLITAKEHLKSILRDIDLNMSKRFIAAFNAINEQFSLIFPRLFGGGRAQIELAEPDEPLLSGIEIIVQPPGKKQQNLALLSGGERALTVIALLFSLLAFKPAPFTVVDEIDAALDEANVQRFSEFLREFAANTQFILVTHRKGTMEVADVMHGVTMEDSGVSRIVSVRFAEQAV